MAKTGRPPSINEHRLKAAEAILNDKDDLEAIICTDEELVMLINLEVHDYQRISYTTFKEYKAWKQLEDEGAKELMNEFSALYMRALHKQKKNLFKKLKDNKEWRQRYARMIERKFTEWNLRIQQDNNNKNSWEVKLTIDYSE